MNPAGRFAPAILNCVGPHPELSLLATETVYVSVFPDDPVWLRGDTETVGIVLLQIAAP